VAYPDADLSPAQQRALTRVRQHGILYSGNGVATATIRVLERLELVKVTWIKKQVLAEHTADGWQNRTEESWTALPVIQDYQVMIMAGGLTVRLTIYGAPGRVAAYQQAKRLFYERYGDPGSTTIEALVIEPMIEAEELLLV
jgi:hypothetical protein